MSGVRVRLVGTERVIGPVLRLAGEVFEVPAQDLARWRETLGDALEVLDEASNVKRQEAGESEVSAAAGEDGEGSADVTTVISKGRRKK